MAKNKQLVSQYLEKVSRDALEKYQDIIKGYVRDRQGVYALYRNHRLYYAGLAHNLRARLNTHLKDHLANSWDSFSVYLTIGDTHIKELESLILRILQPPLNKQKGKFVNAEDLKRKFASTMNSYWRQEKIKMFPKKDKADDVESSSKKKLRGPILSKYLSKGTKLQARYKGKRTTAWASRKGIINYKGKSFNSPSLAGKEACGGKACNGWTFWQYERAPGDWVLLDFLRRK